MIRNVIFDMGGVLIHWDPEEFVARRELPQEDRALLAREVFRSVEWAQVDRGVLTVEEAVTSMCRRLPERLHPVARELTGGWWKNDLIPVEGMAPLLRELRELHYGLYVLSNATAATPKYFHRVPGNECFDGTVFSYEWKQVKPEREIYRTLLEKFSLTAGECLFVDDSPANIEGALFAGMEGFLFRGDVEALRERLRQAGIPVK